MHARAGAFPLARRLANDRRGLGRPQRRNRRCGLVALAGVTAWAGSGWPDIVLGVALVLLNGSAAKEIWEAATEEHLAAQALAGEVDDD